MRNGHYDAPVFLEALADLLLADTAHGQSDQTAVKALMKAAYESENPEIAIAYRKKAENVFQEQLWIEKLETELNQEIDQGEAYYKKHQTG